MTQWIVEGTHIASFRMALKLAQQYADRQQALIPLVRDCPDQGYVVVKMVSPCPSNLRTRAGSEFHEGTFRPYRFEPGANSPAWDQSFPNGMN